MKKIAILMGAVVLAASAQTLDLQHTTGRVNGRYWSTLKGSGKIDFLYGFADALLAADSKQSDTYFARATFGEIEKGLDQFYEEPANASIPVSLAMIIFAMKVRGATAADLEPKIAQLRADSQPTEKAKEK